MVRRRRLALDASADISPVRVRLPRLPGHLPAEVLAVLDTYGFVILRLPDPPSRAELLALEDQFGPVWRHARSDQDGIAPIEVDASKPSFLGTSAAAHPPHTDGAYSPDPPCLVVLSCEEATARGGDTVLISGQHLYDRLRRTDEAAVPALFATDALTIERNAHAVTTPAFAPHGRRLKVIFRQDAHSTTRPAPAAARAFGLLSQLVADPAMQVRTRLERGEVILVDNFGMLHGRTEFDPGQGHRRLLRLNVTGDSPRCPDVFGFDGSSPAGRHGTPTAATPATIGVDAGQRGSWGAHE